MLSPCARCGASIDPTTAHYTVQGDVVCVACNAAVTIETSSAARQHAVAQWRNLRTIAAIVLVISITTCFGIAGMIAGMNVALRAIFKVLDRLFSNFGGC
jgi:hypothetical protein